MSQALSELRGPVSQEALRLRMAALHGREDPLLDPARFPRLLRQANDAEIADVRKVGDDDYEITAASAVPPWPHPARPPRPERSRSRSVRTGAGRAAPKRRQPRAAPARERPAVRACGSAAVPAGPSRAGEIPLIGVVQMEAPPERAVGRRKPAAAAEAEAEPAKAGRGPAGPRAREPRPPRPASPAPR